MKKLLLLVPLGLAACQTQPGTLSEVCSREPVAYALFQLFAPQADPQVVLRVNQAHAIVTGICANPPTDLASALLRAGEALKMIQGATP